MQLKSRIQTIRSRLLADLASAHDYFEQSCAVWEHARESASPLDFTNKTTGNRLDATNMDAKLQEYVRGILPETTFQLFISIFESFIADILKAWLTQYPQSMSDRKVDFSVLLESDNLETALDRVADKEVLDTMFDPPGRWFLYIEKRLKPGCPSADEIARFVEAKATRDVLVHGRGIVPKLYVLKAGKYARHAEGERIELPPDYHREVWRLLTKMGQDLSDAILAKLD